MRNPEDERNIFVYGNFPIATAAARKQTIMAGSRLPAIPEQRHEAGIPPYHLGIKEC
jgi:hypothetical protein